MSGRPALALALALALLGGLAGPVRAQTADLSDAEIGQRLDFLEDRLDAAQLHAQIWTWSWTAIEGGGLVWGIATAVTEHRESDRANAIVQATESAIGLADLFYLRPVEARHGAAPLRALPESTRAERVAKLARGEAMLRDNAARARDRDHLAVHLGNVALNSAGGLVVWAAGDGRQGLISAATGILAGELQFWTEPGRPASDWKAYEKRFGTLPTTPAVTWRVVPAPGGLALRVSF